MIRRSFFPVLMCVALVAVPAAAPAQTALTLSDATARALAKNRDIVIERGHVDSGKITAGQLDEALDVLAMTRSPA